MKMHNATQCVWGHKHQRFWLEWPVSYLFFILWTWPLWEHKPIDMFLNCFIPPPPHCRPIDSVLKLFCIQKLDWTKNDAYKTSVQNRNLRLTTYFADIFPRWAVNVSAPIHMDTYIGWVVSINCPKFELSQVYICLEIIGQHENCKT